VVEAPKAVLVPPTIVVVVGTTVVVVVGTTVVVNGRTGLRRESLLGRTVGTNGATNGLGTTCGTIVGGAWTTICWDLLRFSMVALALLRLAS